MNYIEESEIVDKENIFNKNKEINSDYESNNSSKDNINDNSEEINYDIKNVLITGASGYLGSYCVLNALNKGYKVTAQTRTVSVKDLTHIFKKFPNQNNLTIVKCELTNHKEVQELLKNIDCIINCAAAFEEDTKDEMSIIFPCIEITLTLLHKAIEEKVRRFIHISSAETVYGGKYKKLYTEAHWGNPENCGINERAKIFSERSAWYFYEQNKDDIDFTVFNPALLVGKSIKGIHYGRSSKIFSFIMDDTTNHLMNLKLPLVNINDTSDIIVKSINNKNTFGERYLLCQGTFWMEDLNELLSKEFTKYSYTFEKKLISKFKIWILSFFDSSINYLLPFYGKDYIINEDKAKKEFKILYRPIDETIGEMIHYLILENQIKAKGNILEDYDKNNTNENLYAFEFSKN